MGDDEGNKSEREAIWVAGQRFPQAQYICTERSQVVVQSTF